MVTAGRFVVPRSCPSPVSVAVTVSVRPRDRQTDRERLVRLRVRVLGRGDREALRLARRAGEGEVPAVFSV